MVKKSAFRLIRRKMRSHIPQLAGLVVLLTIGVCFFMTLFTIVMRYEETVEQYIIDNAYADATLYGAFDAESVRLVSELGGIRLAHGRNVRDYRDGERILRVISLTEGINVMHIYEGRLPANETECILLGRNAAAMGLGLGDRLALGDKTLVISGLAASPEYIYLVQSERTMMAQPSRFGVVFVAPGFFAEGYNEIVVLADDFPVARATELTGAFRTMLRKDQPNHVIYRSDLDEIRSFAYIFPFIFAALIAVVIYVMLSRTVQKDRKQIGIMMALGVSDGRIIGVYLSQFCLAALAGALLGCLAAALACDFIIGIFSSMFEVPTLSFVFYPSLWSAAALASVLLCAASGLIALLSILPLLPAHAMRPRAPKGGKRILLQRIGFLWRRFSWDTHYALKNSFRNKSRFIAVVLGMSGSCALITLSLGFYDSIINTQDKYFNEFANYDVIVSFDPVPLDCAHPAEERMEVSYRALTLHVDIQGENYILAVAEKGFDMVNIPVDALQNGVIIPEHFAGQWGVGISDTLKINGHTATVSAVVPQHIGLALYTSFDYLRSVADAAPPIYNTIYGRCSDMDALSLFLIDNGIDFTTIDDDMISFDSIMESMSVLIWFMVACSAVLGFTVLFSVGLINLSAREYEFMFLGVMGYPHKKIMLAHVKEAFMQLVLAIPLGFLLGNLLIEGIKGEFSGSGFVISSAVSPQSYLASALLVLGMTAIMGLVTSRHVGRLDIIEGLKSRDD